MDDRSLISHLLNKEELTYTSKLVYLCKNNWIPIKNITLNKWHPKKSTEDISLEKFNRLKNLGIIEVDSGNFETGEQHYIIKYDGNLLNSLKNLVISTTNTEFETIFREYLLKYERRLKLQQINGKLQTKSTS